MIQFHVYPGGRKRAVTFSYDDGHPNDARLIELFRRYGVKGTFHLNGKDFRSVTEEQAAEYRRRYEGQEIACHTLSHGWPARMPPQSIVKETWEDRAALEAVFGYPVRGMSYPCGSYDDATIAAMEACGIVYSRTTKDTGGFYLPESFMEWHATCHHRQALALCDSFLWSLDSQWGHPLFYIWGHSHELQTEEQWAYMEQLLARLGGNEKIWYATNMEIYRYTMAQRRLEISVDETVFYNPSDIAVWVERDKKDILEIPAGATVRYP